MTIDVVAVDDQPLMLQAFRMILQTEDDIRLVGVAKDGREGIEESRRLLPDVVLMDIRMPNVDGVEATRAITRAMPETKVLVLTTFDLDEYVIEAIRAGASGFLLKDVAPEDLVEAIRTVGRGDALLAPSVTRRLLDSFVGSLPRYANAPTAALHGLTDAEVRVLTLVGKGRSNDEICKELFVSDSTVRTHVRHILSKLELRDRVQAVVYAYEAGLVHPSRR